MRRWKMDNDTIGRVKRLVRFHDLRPVPTPRSVRRMIYKVGEELFPSLLLVQRADILAQSNYRREEKLRALEETERIYREILAARQCLSIRGLAVGGRDLIADGMKPGPALGRTLTALLEHVLEEPEHNTKEYLLALSRALRQGEPPCSKQAVPHIG